MDEEPERKRYYPDEENVTLSVAITEAVEAYNESPSLDSATELYDHINPDAIDHLFKDSANVDFTIQFQLPHHTIAVWGDGGIDIRVTGGVGNRE